MPLHGMNELHNEQTQLAVRKQSSSSPLTVDESEFHPCSQHSHDGLKLHNVKGIICKEVDIHIEKIGRVTVLEGEFSL